MSKVPAILTTYVLNLAGAFFVSARVPGVSHVAAIALYLYSLYVLLGMSTALWVWYTDKSERHRLVALFTLKQGEQGGTRYFLMDTAIYLMAAFVLFWHGFFPLPALICVNCAAIMWLRTLLMTHQKRLYRNTMN